MRPAQQRANRGAAACRADERPPPRLPSRRRKGDAVKRALAVGLAIVAGALAAAALAWLGWAWYESRLPDDLQRDGLRDSRRRRGARRREPRKATPTEGRRSSTSAGPAGTPQRRFTLTAQRQATVRLASGRSVEALSFNGTVPGPGAARARGRARRGDPAKQGRCRRRQRALARRRRAERRGRRRRRDPGRRSSRREPRLPLPGRPGRDVLVPRPPGIGDRGAARPLRRARDRARGRRRARGSPTSWSPSTRSTERRSSTRPTVSSAAPSRRGPRFGSG